MLMAAGLGTRLRPFTDILPKPLLPVMGIPTAQFMVDALARVGVREVVANVHHLSGEARHGLAAMTASGTVSMTISDESCLLLGSAGGIRKALPRLGQRFFIANGDILCSMDFERLAQRHAELHDRYGAVITLALKRQGPAGTAYREIVTDDNGLITRAGEVVEGLPFFTGIAVAEADAFVHLQEGEPSEFLPQVLKPAIESGKAGAFISDMEWYDMGSPKLWLETHLTLIRGLETGRLPAEWDRALRSVNEQIRPGVWMSGKVRGAASAGTGWEGPCYWASFDGQTKAPERFGPAAVGYGAVSESHPANSISMKGICVPLPP